MPTVTKRNVIAKKNSLIITIPKAWTDYYGCKKGDAVKVTINGNLHLSPNPSPADDVLKLIFLGGIYMIHLPTVWVRAHNLKKGDKVELIADGELIIRPVKTSAVKL